MLLAELWMIAREFEFSVREFEIAASMDETGEARWRLAQLYLQRENYIAAEAELANSILAYVEDVPLQLYYLQAVVAINLQDFDTASSALMHIETDEEYAERAEKLYIYMSQIRSQSEGEQL